MADCYLLGKHQQGSFPQSPERVSRSHISVCYGNILPNTWSGGDPDSPTGHPPILKGDDTEDAAFLVHCKTPLAPAHPLFEGFLLSLPAGHHNQPVYL